MKIKEKAKLSLFRELRGQLSSMRIRELLFLSLSAVFVSTNLGLPAFAQVTTGDVLGTVTDQTGAIVQGAKLTLVNLGTGVKSTKNSNEAGSFLFSLLIPGHYSLAVESNGFKGVQISDISLAAGDRVREDVSLLTGSAEETVTVTAAPSLLQTDTSSLTSVVTEQSVQDLPLNGRNFFNLVQVQPGLNQGQSAAISSGNRVDNREQTSTISANGQSDLFNNNMIDGMDNNEKEQGFPGVRPSIDAIAEVKVDTNAFSAEIGRDAGAVVNIITKSGTNTYHGSAYEYFRNDIFNARDFFAYAANANLGRGGTPKPEWRQNQFGGSIGGPVVHDKTFFFADVEDLRLVVGQPSGLQTVPTAYEQASGGMDFTDSGGTLLTPSQISAPGLAYFKMYPAPNTGGPGALSNNFIAAPNETQFALTLDGRIDQHFNNGDQLFGRYSYNKVDTVIPGDFPAVTVAGMKVQPEGNNAAGPSTTSAHGVALNYVHILTPNLAMEFKMGYTRIGIQSLPFNYGQDVSSAIGLENVNTNSYPGQGGLLQIYPGPFANVGDTGGVPILNHNNIFQYMASANYTHGPHSIKVGAQIIRRQLNYFQSIFPLGIAISCDETGNYLEDFVAGQVCAYVRLATLNKPGYRTSENSAFVQDDWRLTRSLTLNLGLRYDIFPAITEAHGQEANFDYPTLTLITGQQSEHVGIHTRYSNFAPRIGFADSLWKGGVLRGGFGISYYPIAQGQQIQEINPPYSYNQTIITFPPSPSFWPVLQPLVPASTTNLSGGLVYEPPNFNTSYVEQFNLMAQQQVGANVFTIGGVGELNRHGWFFGTINAPLPDGPYPNDATQGPPPPLPYLTINALPNVTNIQASTSWGTDNYYAMQAIFARRFTHGLVFNANYTWAHGLGDTDSSSGGDGATGSYVYNPRYDYGSTGLDVRHRIAANWSYQLPFAKDAHGANAVLFKGWEWNALLFWQTGLPFVVTNGWSNQYGFGQTNSYSGSNRLNYVSGQSFYAADKSINQWLNPAAFTPQAAGTLPLGGNNAQYGPHIRRADMSFNKKFDLTEKFAAQFRAELYNISNTPSFQNPNSTIYGWTEGPQHDGAHPISAVGLLPGDIATAASGFGTITSTSTNINPRVFQFALKILF